MLPGNLNIKFWSVHLLGVCGSRANLRKTRARLDGRALLQDPEARAQWIRERHPTSDT